MADTTSILILVASTDAASSVFYGIVVTDSECLISAYKKGDLMRYQAPFFNIEVDLALS